MLAFKRNRYVYLYDTFDRPLAIWQLILELDSKIGGKCNKNYLLFFKITSLFRRNLPSCFSITFFLKNLDFRHFSVIGATFCNLELAHCETYEFLKPTQFFLYQRESIQHSLEIIVLCLMLQTFHAKINVVFSFHPNYFNFSTTAIPRLT